MTLLEQYEAETGGSLPITDLLSERRRKAHDYVIWLEKKLEPFQHLMLIDPQPPAGATFLTGSVGKIESGRIAGKWYWSRKEGRE